MNRLSDSFPDPPAEDTVTGWDGDHALAWQDMDGFWHLATFDTPEQRDTFGEALGTDHQIQGIALDTMEFLPIPELITDDGVSEAVNVEVEDDLNDHPTFGTQDESGARNPEPDEQEQEDGSTIGGNF